MEFLVNSYGFIRKIGKLTDHVTGCEWRYRAHFG